MRLWAWYHVEGRDVKFSFQVPGGKLWVVDEQVIRECYAAFALSQSFRKGTVKRKKQQDIIKKRGQVTTIPASDRDRRRIAFGLGIVRKWWSGRCGDRGGELLRDRLLASRS